MSTYIDVKTTQMKKVSFIVCHGMSVMVWKYDSHTLEDYVAFFFFLRFYLFLETGREGEKHCVVAFWAPPTGDPAHNPGMCPDWESYQWPSGSQAGTQSSEPHQPGQDYVFLV